MSSDEQAIRELVATWLRATEAGDVQTVLDLMSDDVVFTVVGREPFGKDVFAASNKGGSGFQIEITSKIQEIQILGSWAWMRNRLRVSVKAPSGTPNILSGYTLTILNKESNGNWVISRDANVMTPENKAP